MKVVAVIAGLVAAVEASSLEADNFLQMGMRTKRVSAHEAVLNRASASAEADWRYQRALSAMKRGIDIPEVNNEDQWVTGEDGLIEKDIIHAGRMGLHEWEAADSDKPDPRHYAGENTRLIDANDEATNFGEEEAEEDGGFGEADPDYAQ